MTVKFNPFKIIFSIVDVVAIDMSINVITITGKYYIFKCARLNRNLSILDYKKDLEKVYDEQLMLARPEM